jgi:hypothetical protein
MVLSKAFRGIVFAQVRISALNTLLTAIYLAIVLPIFGINLPFFKTMIAITLLVGLLPVIGNLISNTVIVLVSFSVSPSVALASLAFRPSDLQVRLWRMSVLPELKGRAAWNPSGREGLTPKQTLAIGVVHDRFAHNVGR